MTTSTALQSFLNPYNGTSWSNDTSTVNASSGLIETSSYNSTGLGTDSFVKNGSSGTAYYVSATDYGDSVNATLVTASYDYPAQTTTRSNGKQTSYSYTFYDSSTHQQLKTKTTTLPTVSTGQNGSGVATTRSEYYDNLGRLRWTQDGEGYINYYSYHPVMGMLAYQAVDVNPSSVSTDISSGSSGNWEAWTVDGANSNAPTRSGSLPTTLALATKTYYDALGRQTQTTDTGGNNHYTAYANLQTITFPFWNSTTSQSLLPIQVTNLNNGAQVSDEIGVRQLHRDFDQQRRPDGVFHGSVTIRLRDVDPLHLRRQHGLAHLHGPLHRFAIQRFRDAQHRLLPYRHAVRHARPQAVRHSGHPWIGLKQPGRAGHPDCLRRTRSSDPDQ